MVDSLSALDRAAATVLGDGPVPPAAAPSSQFAPAKPTDFLPRSIARPQELLEELRREQRVATAPALRARPSRGTYSASESELAARLGGSENLIEDRWSLEGLRSIDDDARVDDVEPVSRSDGDSRACDARDGASGAAAGGGAPPDARAAGDDGGSDSSWGSDSSDYLEGRRDFSVCEGVLRVARRPPAWTSKLPP
jgi:hypothetical protein